MSIQNRIREMFVKPRSKTIVPKSRRGGSKKLFEKTVRSRDTVKRYADIYMKGGLVTEAIRCYSLSVFHNGFRIEGDDENLVSLGEDFIKEIDLALVGPQAVTDALWAGDAFQEIARGSGQADDRIVALLPRSPETFEIDTDKYGFLTGYRQVTGDIFKEESIPLNPNEIFHFKFESIGGSPYGISLIATAYDDIMRDCWIAESIAEGIKRHGSPKYHVKVGQEGEDIPDEIMTRLSAEMENVEAKNEFITPRDVEISIIDQAGLPNAESYSNVAVRRLCASLGVPEEMLGLGRGSTEATANVRLQVFYNKVRAYQYKFTRSFSTQVLDQVTGRPGAIELVFERPSVLDLHTIADLILKLKQADPFDPIISKEEARALLGFDIVEGTADVEPTEGEGYMEEDEESGQGG